MSYFDISKIKARQILDSRGNPTVEVDIHTRAWLGRADVPSGASTGSHEALELRDKGDFYAGKSVEKAIKNVGKISRIIKGLDVRKQSQIDRLMITLDGTPNKSRLGANAILAVSLAVSKVAANCKHTHYYKYLAQLSKNKKLIIPVPFMNVINGGEHADNTLDFQELMIVPLGKTFSESLEYAAETYYELKKLIHKKYGPGSSNVGDEGGFAPNIKKISEALDLLTQAAEKSGHEQHIKFAIDAAASYFFKKSYYLLEKKKYSPNRLLNFYERLVKQYPIVSIEDPFHEEAFDDFAKLRQAIGKKVNIVGDDLTVTNVARIAKAIKHRSCNTLLLKVNQIGTLTESFAAARLAKQNGWKIMVSHRSGDTTDTFIADLSVGLGCGMIKAGAPDRGERTTKYNRLLRIEEQLGKKGKYGRAMI
ncbi:MAG: phosphopyruvate hydratase [Candidatus Woesearchaeota archaeon]